MRHLRPDSPDNRDEGLNDGRGKYVARLKGAKRQNNQLQLAFEEATTSEARSQSSEGTEASVAECRAESLAPEEQWMEKVCQRENLWQAYKRVKRNGGSPGIDGTSLGGRSRSGKVLRSSQP